MGEVSKLLERAASWTELDVRKFSTATLELIDALAEALKAANGGSDQRSPAQSGLPQKGDPHER